MYRIIDYLEPESKRVFSDVLRREYIENEDMVVTVAADEGNNVIGIVAWELTGDVVSLRHIQVHPHYKRQGIGRMLVYELLERIEQSMEGFTLQVSYSDSGEFLELKKFVEGCGYFTVVDSGEIYVLDPKARADCKEYEKISHANGIGVPFADVTNHMKKEFYMNLSEHFLDLISAEEEAELVKDLSFVSVRDNKITAGIFVKRPFPGECVVEYAVALPGHHNEMGGLMAKAISNFEKLYHDDNLVINALNEGSDNLVHKLFGDGVKGDRVYTGVAFGAASQW